MPSVLNAVGVDVALCGNHDFDFGVGQLSHLMSMCDFPWLLSNVLDKKTAKPLGGAERYVILPKERTGSSAKIGILGIVELEWIATLASVDESDIIALDPVEEGSRLATMLRQEYGCDMVVALTHARLHNDKKFAVQLQNVDIVLGGHDHDYHAETIGKRPLIKSGTDFREFTCIEMQRSASLMEWITRHERVEVSAKNPACPVDKATEEIVRQSAEQLKAKMAHPVGYTLVDIDARFSIIRTRESNSGNWIADLMKHATCADCAILNAGTLRADMIFPANTELTVGDIVKMLPMADPLCVLEIAGSDLHAALENGVSKYPAHEGRFPFVSGIRMSFDPRKEPGNRVVDVEVNGTPIDMSSTYKLCVKEYISRGKDGYQSLVNAKTIVDGEDAPVLPTIVRNYFTCMKTMNHLAGFERVEPCNHSPASKAKRRWLKKHRRASSMYGVNCSIEGRIVNLAE